MIYIEGENDPNDRRPNFFKHIEDYEYEPVVAWGLRRDGSVVGFSISEGYGLINDAEKHDNFYYYITDEYEAKYRTNAQEYRNQIDGQIVALERLKELGIYNGPTEDIDSINWKVRTAFRKFQEQKGLPLTGELDNPTKQAINQSWTISYPIEILLHKFYLGEESGLILDLEQNSWKDTTTAKVTNFFVSQDDVMLSGQPLAEVEIDTSSWESDTWEDTNRITCWLYTDFDGVVTKLAVAEGTRLQVGDVVAIIDKLD